MTIHPAPAIAPLPGRRPAVPDLSAGWRVPDASRAILRQTLYALTRPIGDLGPGTMVAPVWEGVDPVTAASCYVHDGADRGAWVRRGEVERVTGLVVLVDHVDGWSSAFPRIVDEPRARAFAAATLALPAVAGVWVGEVIRQH